MKWAIGSNPRPADYEDLIRRSRRAACTNSTDLSRHNAHYTHFCRCSSPRLTTAMTLCRSHSVTRASCSDSTGYCSAAPYRIGLLGPPSQDRSMTSPGLTSRSVSFVHAVATADLADDVQLRPRVDLA